MSFLDNIRNSARTWLGINDVGKDEFYERQKEIALRRDYRMGWQRKPLVTKYGQPDDNLLVNFTGLIIDRSVSLLFGQGIEFDLPGDGETPEQQYIDKVWELNKKSIFLHKWGLLGSESGTGYIKIVPDGVFDKDGTAYPRLIPLDPLYMTMETTPHDVDTVIRYIIRYNYDGPDGKLVAFKEVIEEGAKSGWVITDYEDRGGGFEMVGKPVKWEYNWANISHNQNLPAAGGPYGQPDITDDVVMMQDRLNFIASNISKIIRYHAHPRTYTMGAGAMSKETWGPDQIVQFGNADGKIANLEMQSDLASSQNFFLCMRQALFDITRTVDIDSVADKLGALTNFGLKVLYNDALAKVNSKRELYGDALLELNSRLLEMNGMDNDPGEIVWPDVLPVNGMELSSELQQDLGMGILDKQSAALIKGYDWEQVQERLGEEGEENNDVGTAILNAFNRGRE